MKLIESKRINQIQGAKQLDLSTRQLRRIQLRYSKDGARGIISKHRGEPSNNKFSDEFKEEIANLIKVNFVTKLAMPFLEKFCIPMKYTG